MWITPADPDFILFQPGETIPILDLKAFPASFIDNLAGEIGADGVVRFPVWIYEDADSPGREIVIESLEQKVIARIGRDRDYSPEWFVRALYPALDTYAEWRREWLTACYDPARVCMRYDLLVGKDNLIQYVWARSIEAARLAEEREAAAMMRSGEGGSVSNLQFTAIGPTTNGAIELTLAWPDEGLNTNVVDIFACTDLCATDWVLADTLTLDMQTNRVVWVDAESTNHVTRFYDAWTHHDSDGDGIPDGREARLYGTDRLQWDTDGDGLSDFAELFVHGTSALNADSDGDGLPDGWEVQYGLDPVDATGVNGTDGDPDGDGFTNLQEFQMGGDPANPAINATQLIHRLMHCRGGSSLRVDVEDSENCGGVNPNRQEVEDVFNVGPLMHCGYLLALTVEGRVEDQNSGYDKVSIRSYVSTNLQSEVHFFEGNNNHNRCAMADKQVTTNVWFWSNGSVRLRYDTVDGLYHTGAYAEITAASFVAILKVESVELVSGATADHVTPPHTWAAVKNTNSPTQYVIVRAEIEPDIDPASLPAGFICWSGGEAVATNQLQRRVPKNVSAHTELVASCGGSSATGHVWVLWSDVTVRHTGDKTAYNAGTDTGNDKDFPDYCGGADLGEENRLTESPKYLGWKVEIKADITPAGVHDVVTSGWDFFQTYTMVDFLNNTNTPTVASNQVDAVFNAGDFQDQTPDPNDDIFGLDGPGILSEVDFNYYKSTCNFKVWARWNGEYVSSAAQWWIRQKADRQGTNYTVHGNSGGNGTTTLEYTY